MRLKNQKKLAALILKVSPKRIYLDPSKSSEIKEAITKSDIKGLIRNEVIKVKPKRGISRSRVRKNIIQKRKGRRKGKGSRKGDKTSRLPKKRLWINKIRIQREFIKNLNKKNYLTKKDYRMLYFKIKGGFFRSRNHIKLYIKENNLIIKNGKK